MGQCLSPFTKKDPKKGEMVSFPCGKCSECLARRISGWSFRLMQEYKRALSAHFLTLTYNNDNVPITKNGFMSLDKDDPTKYFKRLRKLHIKRYGIPTPYLTPVRKLKRIKYVLPKERKIRYYLCGEYGSDTNRPHYHAIVFNAHPNDLEKAWSIKKKLIGDIHLGEVNEASVGYTLKYVSKEGRIPMHQNDDRTPEFAHMSKGLGSNYL